MIQLVLHGPRRVSLEVVRDVVPLLVLPLDANGDGALDRHEHALERQASLVVQLDLVAASSDHRVHERRDLVVLGREHEEAPQDSDLSRSQADAPRLDHQRRHPLDQTAQVLVELLDGLGLHPQNGIRVLPDLRKRELPTRLALGVDRLDTNLSLDLGHNGHTSGVDRREREAIMRQGVTRPETPRDRAEREALETDLLDSPVVGKPIRRRLRNFRPGADAALRALGGPLAWMRRLRAIEVTIDDHGARLRRQWHELRAQHSDDAEFARAWRQLAESWSFRDVNRLIEGHNHYFPAEARLPMNPRTGDFVHVNGRPYTRRPLDAQWILERFPPEGEPEWTHSQDNS